MSRRVLLLLLSILLCTAGCARVQKDHEASSRVPPGNCTEAWVFAPASLILDLAASSEIILNPAVQDFPVYCTPKAASEALDSAIERGERPRGDWAFFRLAGQYRHLVRYEGDTALLREMTQIVDWEKRETPPKKTKTPE